MEDLRGIDTVRIEREALLQKLRDNRESHAALYTEAVEGWHETVINELKKALADAKSGKEYKVWFQLPEPKDHTADYDRVIAMLEMSLDDELELSMQEFAQYALDEWSWKKEFMATNASYSNTR